MVESIGLVPKIKSSVFFWYLHETAGRSAVLDELLLQRCFPNCELVGLGSDTDVGSLSYENAVAVFIRIDNFTEAVKSGVTSVRKNTGCPIIVFGKRIETESFAAWAERYKINFIPKGISNYLTLDNIIRYILLGNLFTPYRISQKSRLDIFSGSLDIKRLFDRADLLRSTLDSIVSFLDKCDSRTAIGVLSLPRSGSKCLADKLIFWAAPQASFFHSHHVDEKHKNRLRLECESAVREGNLIAIKKAEYKLRNFLDTREIIDNSSQIYLFLTERNPVERIRSEFAMKNIKKIEALVCDPSKERLEELKSQFDIFCVSRIKSLKWWYKNQFTEKFGIDVIEINQERWDKYGYDVIANKNVTLVAVKLEMLDSLLDGYFHKKLKKSFSLISTNSASDRNYKKVYQFFNTFIPFQDEHLVQLFNIPEIRKMHGGLIDSVRSKKNYAH